MVVLRPAHVTVASGARTKPPIRENARGCYESTSGPAETETRFLGVIDVDQVERAHVSKKVVWQTTLLAFP
jgi:hypothetical protein